MRQCNEKPSMGCPALLLCYCCVLQHGFLSLAMLQGMLSVEQYWQGHFLLLIGGRYTVCCSTCLHGSLIMQPSTSCYELGSLMHLRLSLMHLRLSLVHLPQKTSFCGLPKPILSTGLDTSEAASPCDICKAVCNHMYKSCTIGQLSSADVCTSVACRKRQSSALTPASRPSCLMGLPFTMLA